METVSTAYSVAPRLIMKCVQANLTASASRLIQRMCGEEEMKTRMCR
jgi:hypothetical protein